MRAAHRVGLISDARMEQRRQQSGSVDYRNARGVMRDVLVRMVNESYERELGILRCPVDMVWGDSDTAASLEMARRALVLIPTETQLTVVPGDHFAGLRSAELRLAIERHAP